jgi:hypothetical protein
VGGAALGVPKSATLGDAAPPPGSLSTVGPRIPRLYLLGSPGSPPPSINLRRMGDEAESVCSQVTATERLLHKMLASVHRNILCPIWVSLKREAKSCLHSNGFLHAFSFLLCSVSVALVSGQRRCACAVGEVTWVREATAAAKVAHAVAMLAAETSAQKAAAAQDSATLCVKDAEDRATLAEREALERVSRVKAENVAALASAREDAEGFALKIALLEDELTAERQARVVSEREHREQFEELTLLQTPGSELCHAIVGPPWVRHQLSEGMRLVTLRHIEMARELAVLRAAVSSTVESTRPATPSVWR